MFKNSTEKHLLDKLTVAINKLLFDEDRTVQEQRLLLEHCNVSINLIMRVIILNCLNIFQTKKCL